MNTLEKQNKHIIPVLVRESVSINNQLRGITDSIKTVAKNRKIDYYFTENFNDLVKFCYENGIKVVAVIIYSVTEVKKLVCEFFHAGIHPIFVNCKPESSIYPYSSVTLNYEQFCFHLTKQAEKVGKTRFAFLGNNPDSYTDALRLRGIVRGKAESSVCDVYNNYGDISACVQEFLDDKQEYDTIFCANDIVASILVGKIGEEKALNVICFGGDVLQNRISGFEVIVPNNSSLGKPVIDIFTMLARQSNLNMIQGISVLVNGDMDLEGSIKKNLDGYDETAGDGKRIDFFANKTVHSLVLLENLLANCDKVDTEILKDLMQGLGYEVVANKNFISMNGLKYRINRMKEFLGVKSKDELIEFVSKYNPNLDN